MIFQFGRASNVFEALFSRYITFSMYLNIYYVETIFSASNKALQIVALDIFVKNGWKNNNRSSF
jgi:hypothetical protein